jgi:F0F1-type ATP synthase membrane subunit b/b'
MALVAIVAFGLLIILLLLLVWVTKHTRRAISHWRGRLGKLKTKVDTELDSMSHEVTADAKKYEQKPAVLRQQLGKTVKDSTKTIDKSLDSVIKQAEDEEK